MENGFFMNKIREELHQLVDRCDNQLLLKEAKALLESEKDWWDELTQEDKNLLLESEAAYGKGNYINQQELLKQFDEWKKK